MWTLVIITLLTAQTGSAGANAFLDFKDQAKCTDAANALAVQSVASPGTTTSIGGDYRIIAKCIAR
jgi:hypothetical protein